MKKLLLTAVILCMTATAFAQTKVGTIDPEFILAKMPELTTVQDALKEYNTDLENQLKEKFATYETALKTANDQFDALSDEEKAAKQQELATMESDITKFRQNASQLVQIKQNELLSPLYKKISDALNEVAKAEGYTQVFTIGNSSNLGYADPAYDLTNAVMAKLGIAAN